MQVSLAGLPITRIFKIVWPVPIHDVVVRAAAHRGFGGFFRDVGAFHFGLRSSSVEGYECSSRYGREIL